MTCHPLTRRGACAWLAGALAVALLPGCAGLDTPRSIVIGEADVQRALARRFPLDRKMLEVLDVRVDAPRVRLLPETNRIAADFSLTAHDRLFGRNAAGQIALESGLRYDDAEQAVRLTQVRVVRLQLDGVPSNVQTTVGRYGAVLAEQVLEGEAVYRFRPEDIARARSRGLQPGTVAVTARGIEITLVAAPP